MSSEKTPTNIKSITPIVTTEPKIHKGGWGEVQRDNDKIIKKIDMLDEHGNYESTSLREMLMLQVLTNSGKTPVINDIIPTDKKYIIKMEDCGTTLFDLAFEISYVQRIALFYTIFRSLVEVLAYMHSVGVIHGDIKSTNIVVKSGKISLIDFGAISLCQNGKYLPCCCTYSSLAPEIYRNEWGPACDVWSLGLVMLFWLFKRDPVYCLVGKDPSFEDVEKLYLQCVNEKTFPFKPIFQNGEKEPEQLIMIYKMLSMNPNERPTMADILHYFIPLLDYPALSIYISSVPLVIRNFDDFYQHKKLNEVVDEKSDAKNSLYASFNFAKTFRNKTLHIYNSLANDEKIMDTPNLAMMCSYMIIYQLYTSENINPQVWFPNYNKNAIHSKYLDIIRALLKRNIFEELYRIPNE